MVAATPASGHSASSGHGDSSNGAEFMALRRNYRTSSVSGVHEAAGLTAILSPAICSIGPKNPSCSGKAAVSRTRIQATRPPVRERAVTARHRQGITSVYAVAASPDWRRLESGASAMIALAPRDGGELNQRLESEVRPRPSRSSFPAKCDASTRLAGSAFSPR